jgi:hypothetical protein
MAKKKEAEKSAQNSEVNKHDKSENNDDEPNFSDQEGFVDNISDEGNLCTRCFQSGLVGGLHMVSVFCYPGLPGTRTRLPATLPAVAMDLGNKNTQNMSQYNDYESVDDMRRASCLNPCIKCSLSAGDEPVEIGRFISRRKMQTGVLTFSFRLSFCHFRVPCH